MSAQVRSQEDADAHAIADPGEYRHRVNQDASQVRTPPRNSRRQTEQMLIFWDYLFYHSPEKYPHFLGTGGPHERPHGDRGAAARSARQQRGRVQEVLCRQHRAVAPRAPARPPALQNRRCAPETRRIFCSLSGCCAPRVVPCYRSTRKIFSLVLLWHSNAIAILQIGTCYALSTPL